MQNTINNEHPYEYVNHIKQFVWTILTEKYGAWPEDFRYDLTYVYHNSRNGRLYIDKKHTRHDYICKIEFTINKSILVGCDRLTCSCSCTSFEISYYDPRLKKKLLEFVDKHLEDYLNVPKE